MQSEEKWYLDIRGTCFVVLAVEQMMMNADTGISEVASAVKRQGWMQVSHADEGRTGLLPAGQAMHSAEPVWLLYLPAAHRAQVPPLGPDEPALHVQSSAESLPDGEFAWAGQLEHVDEELAEYVPAKQFAHAVVPQPSFTGIESSAEGCLRDYINMYILYYIYMYI